MSVATFTKTGTKATTAAKLDKAVFGVEVKNHDLLKQAYSAYLANGRVNLAVTKTRGLVRGGGKKPWRQKGTGRARFGSTRNPIWRGGGIAFGPTGEENYTHKLTVASKRQAIRQALSLANEAGKLIIIEDVAPKTAKTSEVAALMNKIDAKRNVLLVVDKKTPEVLRPTKNLPEVKLVSATYLSVFEVLNSDHIVMTQAALSVVSDWLGGKK